MTAPENTGDWRTIPPQPLPDVDSQGYWDATATGQIAICRCTACRSWTHPPLERCRHCGGPLAYEPISGDGIINAFIVMHRASVPGQGDAPHAIALIDLDDAPGIRLTGRITGDPNDVRVGDRVTAHLINVAGGDYRIPEFSRVS
ncbi:MAG: OB-fold domain-containing protein [Actinomycetota bacterium]|nr:OB-fold domain-containing protein [Actinomycetota bacterium]